MATSNPARASASAAARPMPVAAPVTRALFLSATQQHFQMNMFMFKSRGVKRRLRLITDAGKIGSGASVVLAFARAPAPQHLAHDGDVLAILWPAGRVLGANNVGKSGSTKRYAEDFEPDRVSREILVALGARRLEYDVQAPGSGHQVPDRGALQRRRADIERQASRSALGVDAGAQLAQCCRETREILRIARRCDVRVGSETGK